MSNAEVDDFDLVCLLVDQNILRFDISVNYSFGMNIGQNFQQLPHDLRHSVNVHFFLGNSLKKLPTLAQLHDEDVLIAHVINFK